MVFARMLFKQKLKFLFLVISSTILFSCVENMVNYSDFLEKPQAARKNDEVEIIIGFTKTSSAWVKVDYKINGDFIYLGGKYVFSEISRKVLINLPEPKRDYRIFWVDHDGKRSEIDIIE